MDLASLPKTPGSRHPRKRVGRGMASGHGKTCCRGHKGQQARKGHKVKFAFEGGQMPLMRRLPKRGFTNPARTGFGGVNVGSLSAFPDGTEVTPALLRGAGLAPAHPDAIKILGDGACERKLTVQAHAFSETARNKIEAAGGTCVILER